MSEGLQNAIEELKGQIALKEQEILPLKQAVNQLLKVMGQDPLYDFIVGGDSSSSSNKSPWKIDQFFNRPLATCVYEILAWKKESAQDAPADIDQIYDHLSKGGFRFEGSGDVDYQKRALKTSLTKNTAQFVKIGENVFGLRTWYKMRAARKAGDRPDANAPDDQGLDLPVDPETQKTNGEVKE